MPRIRSVVALLILIALLAACGGDAPTPIAASDPRAKASVPHAAAMEQPDPCVPRWPPHPCQGEEGERVRTAAEVYYYDIDAQGSRFMPASFALSISHQIELINKDAVRHNITIPASGISLDVEPGANDYTRPITLAPGEYEFFCRFHQAAGMSGVLTMTAAKDIITLRRGY